MNDWTVAAAEAVKQQRIPHRNYDRAVSEAFSSIVACEPGEVVCITGPSRVGKSKCIEDVIEALVGTPKHFKEGHMPAITVAADNDASHGYFSTKTFVRKGLMAIQHPFYSGSTKDDLWGQKQDRLVENTAEGILKRGFKTGLVLRGVKYLFIDEAQHVGYAKGGNRTAAAILDSWKCLAAETGVVLILVGAYPLLDVLKQSPHMLGRAQVIHFRRYDRTSIEDIKAHDRFLKTHSQCLRLKGATTLSEWAEFLIEGNLGCAGLQTRWTRAALGCAEATHSEYLELEHYKQTLRSIDERRTVLQEILIGEEALRSELDSKKYVDEKADSKPPASNPKRVPFEAKPARHLRGGRA